MSEELSEYQKKKKDKSWWYNASRCWTPQFFVEIMLPRRKQNTSISNRFKKKKARVTYGLLGGTRKGLAEHSNRVFIRHPPRQRPNTEREQACLFSFSLPPQTSSILFCNFYAYTCFFFFSRNKKANSAFKRDALWCSMHIGARTLYSQRAIFAFCPVFCKVGPGVQQQ